MFAKYLIAGIGTLASAEAATPTQNDDSGYVLANLSTADGGVAGSIVEDGRTLPPPLPVQLLGSHPSKGKALEQIDEYSSEELAKLYQGYLALTQLNDSDIEVLTAALRNCFTRSPQLTKRDGEFIHVSRDSDSKRIVFDNVHDGPGQTSEQVKALIVHQTGQVLLYSGIPSGEVETVISYMLGASDANPGYLDEFDAGGLFGIPGRAFKTIYDDIHSSRMSKVRTPEGQPAFPSPAQASMYDPLPNILVFDQCYLEGRALAAKKSQEPTDSEAFETAVWKEVFKKLGMAALGEERLTSFETDMKLKREVVEETHREQTQKITKTLKGRDRERALREAKATKESELARLDELLPESVESYVKNRLEALKSSRKKMEQRGKGPEARTVHLREYLKNLDLAMGEAAETK